MVVELRDKRKGKLSLGMKEELKKNPERFAGNKILFIHTGGLFGVTDSSLTEEIMAKRRIQPFPSELISSKNSFQKNL